MKTVIIFDHPYTAKACENEPHNRSFSAAICKQICENETKRGAEVDLIDLAEEGFDPVMSKEDLAKWRKGEPMNPQVASYQKRMLEADRVFFIFPIWWTLMPAMTKGFIDKVYAKNILYSQTKGSSTMKTFMKENVEVFIITTMATPTFWYKLIFGKPVVKAMSLGWARSTGIKHIKWIPFSGVEKLSFEKRQKLLSDIKL